MLIEVNDPPNDLVGVASVHVLLRPHLRDTDPPPVLHTSNHNPHLDVFLTWDHAQELHDKLGKFLANG